MADNETPTAGELPDKPVLTPGNDSIFCHLLDNMNEGAMILSPEGRVAYGNAAIATLLQEPVDKIKGALIRSHIAESDQPLFDTLLLQVKTASCQAEIQIKHPDGAQIPTRFSLTSLELNGHPWVSLVVNELSWQKQAEDRFSKSEGRFYSLVEQSSDGIFIANREGRLSQVNQSACRMSGYTEEELLGKQIRDLLPPEDNSRLEEVKQALLKGESHVGEWTLKQADGLSLPIEVSSKILDDGRWQSLVRDISSRKRGEAMLAAADSRAESDYEQLLDRLANLALTFGKARDLLTVYRVLRDFSLSMTPSFGIALCFYDEEQKVRESVYLYMKGVELDVPTARVPVGNGPAGKAIKSGNVNICNDFLKDLSHLRPVHLGTDVDSNSPRSALIAPMATMGRVVGTLEVQSFQLGAYTREHATVMQMAANLAANAIENVRLLHLEREKEEQLRQSQKMEAVGQLAGGIAHDFNNLLTAIIGYSELTMRKLSTEAPLHHNLVEIKKAGERAAALTRQLLAFSRKQVLQPKVMDLNLVVSEMEKMLQRLIGEDVELRTALDPDIKMIKADPSQIEQVILNLAVNARDALPRGGKLTLETHNVSLDEEYARLHPAISPGAYVMLAVSDNGCGMDDSIQARIFEPFFTTKEVGKGTGLGLSTVYGIIKQSGGSILVYSEVGKGTTFKVYLPRLEESVHEYQRKLEAKTPEIGSETILLVEDEEVVRRFTRSVLEASGFKVLEAINGASALQISQLEVEPVHLLLTDVIMPEMSGRELSDHLAPFRPHMKVLYMSGYTNNAITRQGVLNEGDNFIEKPFSPDALIAKVRDVLDKPI